MAPLEQALIQIPHPLQADLSTCARSAPSIGDTLMASRLQAISQSSQPRQRTGSTRAVMGTGVTFGHSRAAGCAAEEKTTFWHEVGQLAASICNAASDAATMSPALAVAACGSSLWTKTHPSRMLVNDSGTPSGPSHTPKRSLQRVRCVVQL